MHMKERCVSSGGGSSAGRNLDRILEFNYETESWTEIGAMKLGRYYHAVSVVRYDDFAKWCK